MKAPAPPPDFGALVKTLSASERAVPAILATQNSSMIGEYLSWDRARFKTPPEGLTHEEWWLGLKMARNGARRPLPELVGKDERPFSFTLPDPLLRLIDEINRSASGSITISEQVTSPATRDRYIVSSLIEEAITSSQLEGASTSRHVAKEMLRSGRAPRDHSERMIHNNFNAMQLIRACRDEPLTPALICEIHEVVTDGTLDDPRDAGRVPTDQEARIAIWADGDQLLHRPPPVDELSSRIQMLCDFANGSTDTGFYMPPVLRAIAVHFMVGFDHYFAGGNGSTARALFYWTMLRSDYWLTEFITISTILKLAPAQYARSFLLTEQDDGDLTHFFIYHCTVVTRAIAALHEHLARKAQEVRGLQELMSSSLRELNHRQVALLEHAIREPGPTYTARSHATSHSVTTQTARTDLLDLEQRGLLTHSTRGRLWVWASVDDLAERLKN